MKNSFPWKLYLIPIFIFITVGVYASSDIITNFIFPDNQEWGYGVSANTTSQINVHGECKKVTAPSGKNIFVPTRNKTLEWDAFKANAGMNVWAVITDCAACGNGIIESWETCDDGIVNSDIVVWACQTDCNARVAWDTKILRWVFHGDDFGPCTPNYIEDRITTCNEEWATENGFSKYSCSVWFEEIYIGVGITRCYDLSKKNADGSWPPDIIWEVPSENALCKVATCMDISH